MKDERLSAAFLSYVGWDTDATLPGRHPDRIADGSLKNRALEVIAMVDAEKPGRQGLQEWGLEVGDKTRTLFPGLSREAIDALVALVAFEWR